MVMSIEDFISQPGRERLTKLHPDRIDHETWFESSGNGISKSVLKMMQGLLKDPYPTYSSMPAKEQDLWLKQFAQEFNWDRNLTLEVRKAFDKDISSRYRGTINEWKQRWVKDKKPRGVNDKVFEGLQLHWVKPETQAISKTNSKNRKSDRGRKGIATHNLGGTSHYTRGEQIVVTVGFFVTPVLPLRFQCNYRVATETKKKRNFFSTLHISGFLRRLREVGFCSTKNICNDEEKVE
jgi:hypothetical protein